LKLARWSALFRSDLRRQVILSITITRDAPISRLDLLACRNTLMYFNIEAQAHIIDRFHFALREGGFLFLGRARALGSDVDGLRQQHVASSGTAPMNRSVLRRRPPADDVLVSVRRSSPAADAISCSGSPAAIARRSTASRADPLGGLVQAHHPRRRSVSHELGVCRRELRSLIEQATA
jgi:hypothetical protein